MVKKLLELFSGTKSVGKVAEEMGYEVISLDLKNADINCNILDWNYKVYPSKHFDVVWASPPCTEYSRAKTTGIRKIDEANTIVRRTLDIIAYFNPEYWFLENPQSGLLKSQVMMYGLPFKDVDYCKYGFPYRKRTRVWNNARNWKPKPLCQKDCDSMDETRKRHKEVAQRLPCGKKEEWGERPKHKQSDLYRIPSELIVEIFHSLGV